MLLRRSPAGAAEPELKTRGCRQLGWPESGRNAGDLPLLRHLGESKLPHLATNIASA
jgi:hypothetical protein